MTRVSENSTTLSIRHTLNKHKSKMEDLQMKGTTLKSMRKPSDNPAANIEALQISSVTNDNAQFKRNADFAILQLNITEKALENLTDVVNKAKEIAIAQSSDIYNADVRRNVANEVHQLRNLALSIANKRVGQRYIFSGYKTLQAPFDENGKYLGDTGHTTLEVGKDFFVQVNLHGKEVFMAESESDSKVKHPLEKFPEMAAGKDRNKNREIESVEANNRDIASVGEDAGKYTETANIFGLLDSLAISLENNDPKQIQNLLEKFDTAITRLVTLRTRVGSVSSSVMSNVNTIEANDISNMERKSKLVDADVTELFSDITRQQEILKTAYKTSEGLLNRNLLDFLR
ncbi:MULTISPECIES: flagellar hook-associated protein FlgL [Halobacteriovorax]|uniref:Flagellar hook-associated protein 3 n=1 Tax=Halobacteriovorax vibrionivorans TaxID=2152716 RepID=A0ABY0IJ65_9BACT|nr:MULTISPECIES: flagellar hook-associated protein FlgL [Halobacteriovorax]AYF45940.1 flagellar hook-associated protein 3 [Halobacteriovorax sp. BALOs_7]RZF22973.1 flagellar hook-associated protein 3 [Halobacteriovorax vibrionivorans]TGD46884.1 flagellar hook-associated protein 3 [Halobacteriovorax sp. Y22]